MSTTKINSDHNTPVKLGSISCTGRQISGDAGFFVEECLLGGRVIHNRQRSFFCSIEKLVVETPDRYARYSIPDGAIYALSDAWADDASDMRAAFDEFKGCAMGIIASTSPPKRKRCHVDHASFDGNESESDVCDAVPGIIFRRRDLKRWRSAGRKT